MADPALAELVARLHVSKAAARAANQNPLPWQKKLYEAQDRADTEQRAIEAAQQPKQARTRKRRPTVDAVVRQLKRAGVDVASVKLTADGTITVITGKTDEAKSVDGVTAIDLVEANDAAPIDRSDWH